ncbi:MAG: outer membrane beta-barrel domain-containing protein [Gammaproteobacteria bacterium]|jgi:outer membrane beta-barrel protein|nr:outer membrane beta-barrel domain-containing protein [Gammaproteobacteria bacterium]
MTSHPSKGFCFLLVLGFLVGAPGAFSQTQEKPEAQEQEQVIQPDLERRDIKIPRIDTENFEVGFFSGILSVEDFGSESVTGARVAYHITEDFFIEVEVAESTVSDSSFRDLGAPLFPNEDEDLEYYSVSIGYNVFPGEIFIGKKWAMTSAVYILAGVGNTDFIDEDLTTVNFGIGFRILPTDWLAFHVDMRDYVWDSDLVGRNERTNNFELSLGFTAFF